MGKLTKTALRILGSSLLCASLIGCGLTLGPITKRKVIIVQSGTGIEILDSVKVTAHTLKDEGDQDPFEQNIGGWIALHPDHWQSVKNEIERLRNEIELLNKEIERLKEKAEEE